MSETEETYIVPSPGLRGAFVCRLCGGSDLGVVLVESEAVSIVRLVCRKCTNHVSFSLGGDDGGHGN